MRFRKYTPLFPVLLGILLMAGLFVLWPASEANAQCGSQASSCKNCHEVQGQDPVNADGTGWHQGHAFGDFCYLCHAGNNQSMDKEVAHTGMVPPLSDVQASCQSCHPGDLEARAQVYATALGVEIGSGGGGAPASGSPPADEGSEPPAPQSAPPAAPAVVVDQADVIDYTRRYEETVLGRRFINWGNVVLSVLIGLVAVGGGGYAYLNERRLRGLPLPGFKARPAKAAPAAPLQIEGYSAEVVALLPRIAQLNPVGLHALKRLLENPEDASELLHSLSRLDPDLVRRLRSLDRESRAMLLALSSD